MTDEKWSLQDANTRSLALRNESALLGSAVTNRAAAEVLNVSPTTLSEWRQANMPRAMAVLAAHGMKVVDFTDKTLSKDEWRMLKLARIRADMQDLNEAGCTTPGELGER